MTFIQWFQEACILGISTQTTQILYRPKKAFVEARMTEKVL